MSDLMRRVAEVRAVAGPAVLEPHRDDPERLRELKAAPEPMAERVRVPWSIVSRLYEGSRPLVDWSDDELAAELAGYYERPWTPEGGQRRMDAARELAVRAALVNGTLTVAGNEEGAAPVVEGAAPSVSGDQPGAGAGAEPQSGLYPVTRRRRWNQVRRPVAFVNLAERRGICDDGRTWELPKRRDVGCVLMKLPDRVMRVLLVGSKPGDGSPESLNKWAMPDKMPASWSIHERGHYLESSDFPVLRYRSGDRTVEVQRAATWFGEGRYSADLARSAYRHVDELLHGAFDGAGILATPATTGRDLFMRTIPHEREWPVLSDELQQLVRATSGQGRIELFQHFGDLPGLCELDGRLMYGALCWGLGGGVPTRDESDEYAGMTRGRYRVRVTVPADWQHVGLVGVKAGDGWEYPAEPGRTFDTWADGAEVGLCLQYGWPVRILERLLFPSHSPGPLDVWSRRLVDLWQRAEQLNAEPELRQLVRSALRAVLLHGLGAFHGSRHLVTHTADIDRPETVPESATRLRIEADRIVWAHDDAGARWAEVVHPEWSAAVWARCRVRLLDGPTGTKGVRSGALHVDRAAVVAMRTDALYLTCDPAWPDDGKPGRLRRKSWRAGPMPAPTSAAELLALRAGGR